MKSFFNFLILFFGICPAFSGIVTQSKNNKVLIDFKNEVVNVGDQFFILTADNKKIAIVQIALYKNQKAIADVLKGTPAVGQTTSPRSQNKTAISEKALTKETVFLRNDLIQIGFQLKYMMNSITAKETDSTPAPATNTELVSMTGSNFGLATTADYPLYDWLRISGQISFEMLDVAGIAQYNSCDAKTSKNCNAKISYLGFQGLARYDFTKTKFNFWAGLGGAIKIPVSKSSTALNVADLTHSDSMTIAAGLDYHLNNKSYVPVSFEYQLSQNKSEEVPVINQMSLMFGYGIKF